MELTKISDEVFYMSGSIVTLGPGDLDFVKKQARQNARKIARICAHRDVDSRLHEMIIVNFRETYIRPHKNRGKEKSFLVLEGELDVLLFDDQGTVTGKRGIAARSSHKDFFFRLHDTQYHTLRTRSECVVFLETSTGPFAPGDTIFAPWAPENSAAEECDEALVRWDSNAQQLTAATGRP